MKTPLHTFLQHPSLTSERQCTSGIVEVEVVEVEGGKLNKPCSGVHSRLAMQLVKEGSLNTTVCCDAHVWHTFSSDVVFVTIERLLYTTVERTRDTFGQRFCPL